MGPVEALKSKWSPAASGGCGAFERTPQQHSSRLGAGSQPEQQADLGNNSTIKDLGIFRHCVMGSGMVTVQYSLGSAFFLTQQNSSTLQHRRFGKQRWSSWAVKTFPIQKLCPKDHRSNRKCSLPLSNKQGLRGCGRLCERRSARESLSLARGFSFALLTAVIAVALKNFWRDCCAVLPSSPKPDMTTDIFTVNNRTPPPLPKAP